MAQAPMMPETEGPRSKRALILTAAIEKFGKDGYEHTKWATIADQVGIGQTALYHYFESKAHCLLTIMSLELRRSLEAVREVTADVDRADKALEAAIAAPSALSALSTSAVTSRKASKDRRSSRLMMVSRQCALDSK